MKRDCGGAAALGYGLEDQINDAGSTYARCDRRQNHIVMHHLDIFYAS